MTQWKNFRTRVPGKWVLAGEHSVLRGGTAVAIPHHDLALELEFDPSADASLTIEPKEASKIIRELIEEAGRPPGGKLTIKSTIPSGAGFGSSAALCVAIARWMAADRINEVATRLEHRFHGRSSGMDVAVTSAGEAISFTMAQGPKPLGVKRFPKFTFHDTGLRARTSECILKVEKLREQDAALSARVDQAMAEASRLALEGLVLHDSGDLRAGLERISRSMKQAQECFLSWGLVPAEGRRIAEQLMREGALAAKITGAGGGGFIVALWP